MAYYGDCLVFYQVPEKYEYSKTRELKDVEEYIFRMNKILSSMRKGARQQERAESDIKKLNEIANEIKKGKRYGVTRKQYVGHRNLPDKAYGKYPVIGTGRYVWW